MVWVSSVVEISLVPTSWNSNEGLIFELQRRFHRWPLDFDDFLAEVDGSQGERAIYEAQGLSMAIFFRKPEK